SVQCRTLGDLSPGLPAPSSANGADGRSRRPLRALPQREASANEVSNRDTPSPCRGESAMVQARRCAMGRHDRRTAWQVGLALTVLLALAGLARAQEATKAPPTPKLPEPLPHEAIREQVARLSDVEVRQLLIAQLDRGAAPDRPP